MKQLWTLDELVPVLDFYVETFASLIRTRVAPALYVQGLDFKGKEG